MDKAVSFLADQALDLFFNPCIQLLGWALRYFFSPRKRHNIWTHTPPRRLRRAVDRRTPLPRSQLGELPDEILLQIMRNLDASSLLCLRRTSLQFLRLFADKAFREYHGEILVDGWLSENLDAIESNKAIRTFRGLIARDRLCDDCRAARAGPDSKMDWYQTWAETPLHCVSCDVDHPACAFSNQQRRLPPSERVCIAREGAARISERQTLRWDDIEQRVFHEAAPARQAAALYTCRTRDGPREIRFAFYGATYRITMAQGVRWRGWVTAVEWDWEADEVPWWERDWCSERNYTWISAETSSGRRGPLVPESFWYRQIDPASFALTVDDDSFGVTWCWCRSCPNYWKCFELRRGRRVYIPCLEGCEREAQI